MPVKMCSPPLEIYNLKKQEGIPDVLYDDRLLIFFKCIIIINSKSAKSTVVRTLSWNGNNIPTLTHF